MTMINRVYLDANGKIISTISAIAEILDLNQISEHFIDVDEMPAMDQFWSDGEWLTTPEQPSPHHIFDYNHKIWIDPRTLDQHKDQKWSEIKLQREIAEYGGFIYEDNIFDSDVISQGRLSAAAQLGVSVDWTLQDNSVVNLTHEQLLNVMRSLAAHISTCHERGRIARQLIYDSQTTEDLEKISF